MVFRPLGNQPFLNSDDNNGGDLDFADLLCDSHVDIRAGLFQDIEAICMLCRSDNVAEPEGGSVPFCLALQNLKAITESHFAVSVRNAALECVQIVKQTVAELLA